VTIGVFDGVHRGHADIIGRAVRLAAERGQPSVLITFVPHPSEVVRPGSHPPMLTTLVRRAELVQQLGVDAFLALPFTLEFSQLPPDEFVHRVLVERLHASGVIVGANFRFGHRAAGDVPRLAQLGERFGFSAEGVTLLRDNETVISATYIRSRVQTGDMHGAATALGRPHRVDGVVERGDQRGRKLGYPTANLRTDEWAALPADGVYAGRVVRLDEAGRTLDVPPVGVTAISVGTNPTFEVRQRRVEGHILDFDGDLYGDALGFEFTHWVRGQIKFEETDELIEQMGRDVDEVRRLAGGSR
jgi:riboflavin kinase/FMN adenylyltransferase